MFYGLRVITLALLFACAGTVAAQTKIAVVDVNRVAVEAPQTQELNRQMEKAVNSKQMELKGIQDKVLELEQKMERDGAIMSQSQRAKLERDIVSERRELKRRQEEARDDLGYKEREFQQKMFQLINKTVEDYAKANKIDLVVAQGIIYVDDKLNITDAIIKQLQSKK